MLLHISKKRLCRLNSVASLVSDYLFIHVALHKKFKPGVFTQPELKGAVDS